MESSLDQALDNALIAPEIDGVCVIDSNGFCIASKGTLSSEGSAVYKQILMAATRMDRTSGHPTITLTTESGEKIFIQEQNGVVVALNIKGN
ncbi:unnamed protein product, partial [Mesorhabditis belari]|uniref:Late endosomal/lysosomal adaptor and MAPK and MTOR activator 5 n=1 Tax=Mesorhabditis belari TaxID=2138241 RepID=A0AAF3F629_9BILA